MNKLLYTDRPPLRPKVVYCDTSFLFQIYMAADANRIAKLRRLEQSEARSARLFFEWASKQGVEFVASILTMEEIASILVLGPVKEEAGNRALRGWKSLRQSDPSTFATLLDRGRRAGRRFHSFIIGSGIHLVGGGRVADESSSSNLPRRVYHYARLLLAVHELDAMDAYHIALARYCRIDWAASADSDWFACQRLNVIAPR